MPAVDEGDQARPYYAGLREKKSKALLARARWRRLRSTVMQRPRREGTDSRFAQVSLGCPMTVLDEANALVLERPTPLLDGKDTPFSLPLELVPAAQAIDASFARKDPPILSPSRRSISSLTADITRLPGHSPSTHNYNYYFPTPFPPFPTLQAT